jgi:phosphoserine aminotransferase
MNRVFNFAPGPAAMPLEALETAAREMASYKDTGVSVMEMSHRSKMYLEIFDETVALVRELMAIPDEYAVLLLQGGATAQFAAVPMNLLTGSGKADYVDSGSFAHGAMAEAEKYGTVRAAASSRDAGYTRVPEVERAALDPEADYVHITTNNTIYGTRFTRLPDTGRVPLVADMSSNILSEVYDVRSFGVIYAGAQKNIGPAGVTLVVVRKDLLGREMPATPKVLSWKKMADAGSMLNTPATYSIYMAGLCLKWLKKMGGVAAMEEINLEKAKMLYDFLDGSRLFKGVAEAPWRSRMNVTFRSGDEALDAAFVKEAAAAGLINLKGHRSVGGMRASIYNAMPVEGVRRWVDFMKRFEAGRA